MEEMVKEITAKLDQNEIQYDVAKIRENLAILINDFGVSKDEARRAVISEFAKKSGKTVKADLPATITTTIENLAEGMWATVVATVVSVSHPPHKSMAAAGIIADASGSIKFVQWAKGAKVELMAGRAYEFENLVVDSYKGVLGVKFHSGTTIKSVESADDVSVTLTPMAEIVPGICSFKGKVVREFDSSHENILQAGVIGDETTSLKFTVWKDRNAKGVQEKSFEVGSVYQVLFASADTYKDATTLNLTDAQVTLVDGEDMDVANGNTTSFSGVITQVFDGSGLIRRCPVEGCGKVLSRRLMCPVHEIQRNYVNDLRLKAVIDNGHEAITLYIGADLVTALSGMTIDEAVKVADSGPLGYDDVKDAISANLVGRYVSVVGGRLSGNIFANAVEIVTLTGEDTEAWKAEVQSYIDSTKQPETGISSAGVTV